MNARTLVVAVVGAGCVAAAGVGAYLGVRSGASPLAAPAVVQTAGDVQAPASPAVPDDAVQARSSSEATPTSTAPSGPALPARNQTPAPASRQIRTPTAAPPRVIPTEPPPAAPVEAQVEPPPDSQVSQPDDRATQVPDQPKAPEFDERTVAAASVIGIRLDTSVSSETARIEDRVSARVTRAVNVDGQTVIPAGARLDGFVTVVERGGKMRDRARLGVRFDTLVIGDDTAVKLPIQTETIFRDGEPPSNEASSRISASAVVGTILGAVLGGRRGAAIGGAAGAASGTAAVMAGDRNAAVMTAGTLLTVRLTAPVSILVLPAN